MKTIYLVIILIVVLAVILFLLLKKKKSPSVPIEGASEEPIESTEEKIEE